jgi:hypothetical protein
VKNGGETANKLCGHQGIEGIRIRGVAPPVALGLAMIQRMCRERDRLHAIVDSLVALLLKH